MSKISIILPVALLAIIPAGARTLTPAEALARLDSDGPMKARVSNDVAHSLVYTENTPEGIPAAYVFADNNDGGFTILSADDCAYPVLAYSDSGSFDADDMPPAMKWWLGEYARQIEYAAAHGNLNGSTRLHAKATRQAIQPLLKTQWDQDEPYNLQCPKYGTEPTYTGCVATAMAQAMKYFNYPEKGNGSISYNATSIDKRLSLNFGRQAFDWSNMLDSYTGDYTEAQANAVAYLMKACGYAVRMDYGTDSSGALALYVPTALVKYFNYDPGTHYELRSFYSTSQWEDMIYENLAKVGPVVYGGGSLLGGGHAFVCDGYDGKGYFHFNWGWTGMSNGYFSLDALNPYALGSGGGDGGGYNFTQEAILGMQPPTGNPVDATPQYLVQSGSLAAVVSGSDLIFDLFAENGPMWINYNPNTLEISFGAIIEPIGDPEKKTYLDDKSKQVFTIMPGYGTGPEYFHPSVDLAAANLPDGKYRIYLATVIQDSDPRVYTPLRTSFGYSNYVTVTRSGGTYTVENNDVDRLEVIDAHFSTGLYSGMINEMNITVTNHSDIEIARGFAPILIRENQLVFIGESTFITVPPKTTVSRSWITELHQLASGVSITTDTSFMLTLFDESTYNTFEEDVYKSVVMHPRAPQPQIETAGAPYVPNGSMNLEQINGRLSPVYYVTDKRDIQVAANLVLRSGLFGYNTVACITSPQGDSGAFAIHTYNGYPISMTITGQSTLFKTSVPFVDAQPGELYYILMAYVYANQLVSIGPSMGYFRIESAGVDNIVTDTQDIRFDGTTVSAPGMNISIWSLDGKSVANGYETVDTSVIPNGIYIARTEDGKSLKIAIH